MNFFSRRLTVAACVLIGACSGEFSSAQMRASLRAFVSENPPSGSSALTCKGSFNGVPYGFGVDNYLNQQIPSFLEKYRDIPEWDNLRGMFQFASVWVGCSGETEPGFKIDSDQQGAVATCNGLPVGTVRFAGPERMHPNPRVMRYYNIDGRFFRKIHATFTDVPIEIRRLSSGHCRIKSY